MVCECSEFCSLVFSRKISLHFLDLAAHFFNFPVVVVQRDIG